MLTANAKWLRLRRAQRLADGRCAGCGKKHNRMSKTRPGERATKCEECAAKETANTTKWQARMRANCRKLGICDRCFKNLSLRKTNPLESDSYRCAVCQEAHTDNESKHKEKRYARQRNAYAVKTGRACWLPGFEPQVTRKRHGIRQPKGLHRAS